MPKNRILQRVKIILNTTTMKKVSICMLFEKTTDYWQTLYFFERVGYELKEKQQEFLVKGTPKQYIKTIYGTHVELIFGFKNEAEEQLKEYLKNIADKIVDVTGKNKYEAYNKLFTLCEGEYVCVISNNVFPQKNWLSEIIFNYENIKNSGVVSICNDVTDANCIPLVNHENDTFHNVIVPQDNLIKNECLYVFLREHLFLIGGFDTTSHLYGNEFKHLQLRYSYMLYNNYYIPNQSVVTINEEEYLDENLQEKSNKHFEISIKIMKKQRSFYIPIPTKDQ